jgi:hypothetical protein
MTPDVVVERDAALIHGMLAWMMWHRARTVSLAVVYAENNDMENYYGACRLLNEIETDIRHLVTSYDISNN